MAARSSRLGADKPGSDGRGGALRQPGAAAQPVGLEGIRAVTELFPICRRWRCSTRRFTRRCRPRRISMPFRRSCYEDHQVRRYGFHGTSHHYVRRRRRGCWKAAGGNQPHHRPPRQRLQRLRGAQGPQRGLPRWVSLRCEGLVMGTRSGDVDPNLLEFLAGARESPRRKSPTCSTARAAC